MPEFSEIRSIRDFTTLIRYLRRNLNWPVDEDQVEDLAFDYTASELGLDEKAAVRIREIKQLRPVTDDQPWGIFWIDFEPKRLPVVVMRRILAALVMRKRGSRRPEQAAWDLQDLMFISATGEGQDRGISFAHFQETESGQPQLRTFSWDAHENHFYYLKYVNLEALRWPEDASNVQAWRECWSSAFRTEYRYTITTSQALAGHMARLASATRSLVNDVFGAEQPNGPLHKLYISFKRVLIHDLNVDDFADMYAQTVTYGLFSAYATPHCEEFTLDHIAELIPATNPFLRELFAECVRAGTAESGEMDLDELGVGELMDLLRMVDMQAILQDFGRQTRGEDPVIHFYESFLREYDAEKKAKRGVFYTPEPVVKFIVNSVDYLLRTEFDCPDGLADTSTMEWNGEQVPRVQILDPATGTGTFLVEVIKKVWETFFQKYGRRGARFLDEHWNEFVPKHLLPRLHGFELLMAPYSVAHLKLGLKLREFGYRFESDERLRVYLTNALQPAHEIPRTDSPLLANEAESAGRVKNDYRITVVIGNPPYAVNSSNQGAWITNLIRSTYYPNDHIKEQNPKILLDDYVKFIKFGEWIIDRTGQGVLAYITNHAYIDNPTFRAFRKRLITKFDSLYILDLHGNSNKKEVSPDGTKDENVFDIQQGVAICFLVKTNRTGGDGKIFHGDLFGSRERKYSELATGDITSINWTQVKPTGHFYLFAPQNTNLAAEYNAFKFRLSEIFKVNSNGIKTHRDHFALDFDFDDLVKKIDEFRNVRIPDDVIADKFKLHDTRDWKLSASRRSIAGNSKWMENFVPCLYRPFDTRPIYFHSDVVELPRQEVMKNFILGENLGLISVRQVAEGIFNHAFVSKNVIECRSMVSNKGAASIYPLYLYPDGMGEVGSYSNQLPMGELNWQRKSNISQDFGNSLAKKLNLRLLMDGLGDFSETVGPEGVFFYIYSILHSPIYRKRYSDFLKIDFPRIPVPSSRTLFGRLALLGRNLVYAHLLEFEIKDSALGKFEGWADNFVLSGFPKYSDSVVQINPQQGFRNVPENIWSFHIGGYQVLEKWLKDRRGRQLSPEDISHYQKIIIAIQETIRLMDEIDAVIEEHGGWPIQ